MQRASMPGTDNAHKLFPCCFDLRFEHGFELSDRCTESLAIPQFFSTAVASNPLDPMLP